MVDCVVWMRVMFLAGREVGLDQHRVFWAWYTQFIAHFIAVYERTAPPYTQPSLLVPTSVLGFTPRVLDASLRCPVAAVITSRT